MAGVVRVRPEGPGDEAAIHAVHAASFPTAGEARLVDALRAAARLSVSLVAVDDGQVVGHVAFSPVRLAETEHGLGLAPVAVLPEFRRRGIAAALVREGLAACVQAGAGFVVVLGEPDYYARFGFAPARRWGARDAYGGGDAFQALELRPLQRSGDLFHLRPRSDAAQPPGVQLSAARDVAEERARLAPSHPAYYQDEVGIFTIDVVEGHRRQPAAASAAPRRGMGGDSSGRAARRLGVPPGRSASGQDRAAAVGGRARGTSDP